MIRHLKGGTNMAKQYVNLDALLPREDFEDEEEPQISSQLTMGLRAADLESKSVTFELLRKPDFQRETADWQPKAVFGLIESFLDGNLIPSLILWRSPTQTLFVIDGAHRLSALIAWIHDDYGDGVHSRRFYENLIPPEQERVAETTRRMVAKGIGSYEDVTKAGLNPEHSDSLRVTRARNMVTVPISLQWVQGGAPQAEESFFKINQKAVPIDPVELRMIRARRKPNALAARALIRAGVGHKYWSAFEGDVRNEIESIAREVYDALFDPPLTVPIKTLDLPVAGRGYSGRTVRLLFDYVNIANDLATEASQAVIAKDETGEETVSYLKKVKRIATRLTTTEARSLGLHPAVYFYRPTGRYRPAGFLAAVTLVKHLEETDGFFRFTSLRKDFEEIILSFHPLIDQVERWRGGGLKAYGKIADLYMVILDGLEEAHSTEQIIADLKEGEFGYLKEASDGPAKKGADFSRDTKSATFLREALEGAVRCSICGARLHQKSITVDHVHRKEEGGTNSPDNAQLAHGYCNTGYKESQVVGRGS